MINFDSQRLRAIIKSSGLKYGYIAEKCGISRQAFSYKINGKREFTLHEIHMLVFVLDISVSEAMLIFFNSFVPPEGTEVRENKL